MTTVLLRSVALGLAAACLGTLGAGGTPAHAEELTVYNGDRSRWPDRGRRAAAAPIGPRGVVGMGGGRRTQAWRVR